MQLKNNVILILPKIYRWHFFIKRLTETLVSILLCTACVPESDNNEVVERKRTMYPNFYEYFLDKNKNEIKINLVLGIRKDPVANRINIITDRANELWLDAKKRKSDKDEIKFSREIKFLQISLSKKKPIVIIFNSNTKEIKFAYFSTTDRIVGVSDLKDNRVLVHAMKRPTYCFLKKDHPRFNELYAKVHQAYVNQNKGVIAALGILPGGSYIEDVVVIELSQAD